MNRLSTSVLVTAAGVLACIDSSLVGAALPGLRATANLSSAAESAFMAVYLVGLAASAGLSGWGLGRFGDRRTLSAGMALVIAGCCTVAGGRATLPLLLAGRFLHGLGCGTLFIVIPFIVAERCDESRRGRMGLLFQLSITFGLVLGSLVGWAAVKSGMRAHAWQIDYLASIAPALLVLALARRLPVSTARNAARPVDKEHGHRRLSARVVIAVTLPALVQLTGAGVVFCYGVTLLDGLGFVAGAANLGDAAIKAINMTATATAMFMVDRAGRRPLVVGGFSCVSLAMGLAACAILLPGLIPPCVAVLGFALFVAAFAIGPGGCTWLVPGELLPPESRSWGLSLAALGSHAASCAVVASYKPAAQALGAGTVLAAFAVLACLATLLMTFLLPETRN